MIDSLGIGAITHFYSSEPYGDHMSRALGAIDRRVDEARRRVPVSARDVRRDPFALREYVHPLVCRDLIVNVALLGAPSSGKTTLAARLDAEQLVEIAEGHLQREDALLALSNRYLFTDTNALTTATFARSYHGAVGPRLAALADEAVMRYDLTFVCDIDIPYDDTWDRSGEVDRAAFQRQVLADLSARKVPFIMLRGTLDARVARVSKVLSRFSKYANVLEVFQDARGS